MEPRDWRFQVHVNDQPARDGVLRAYQDFNSLSMALTGVYSVNTWRTYGTKKDADGNIIGLKIIARHRGQVVTATAHLA